MRTTASYLSFKEYSQIGSLNRRFYRELRGSIGAKCTIHYIKIRVIDQQPQYTISYKYNANGGGIQQRLNANLLSPIEVDQSFNSAGTYRRPDHNYSIASNSIFNHSLDVFNMPNVTQSDLQKFSNSERVQ